MSVRNSVFFARKSAASARWSLVGVIAFSLGVVVACSGESDNSGDDDAGGRGGSAGSSGGSSGSSGKGGGAGNGGSTAKGGSAGQAATGGTSPGEAGAGGDSGVAGEGGSAGGTSGTGGTAGSAGAPGDVPLLERPVRLEHDCSAGAPLEKFGINPWMSGALGQTASGTFVLYGEGTEFIVTDLVLSSIDADGTFGSSVSLATAGDGYFSQPDLAAHAEGLAALWQEGGANSAGLYFAALDASGAVTQERKRAVDGVEGLLSAGKLAGGPDGYVAFYTLTSDDFTTYQLELAVLDATGTLVGTPKTLLEGTANIVTGAALAVPGGYAFTYSTHETSGLEPEAQTYLAFLDGEGNPDGEPIPLGERITEYANFTQSLLVLGEQLVVAYSQQTGSYENSDIALSLHLARFDLATHAPIGESAALQAPVEDQENTQPKLVALGDDIGLVWSQGGVIYICAGCMPDNHLEFVVLDGEDLNPVSEVVRFENDAPMGGFVLPQIASFGDSLLVTSTLQYHVSGEGAFGSITCTAAR